ncbi:MAG: efflux RND transporter periplasmic adaptor subunit [Thermoanaerobaculales bacterium]|jgi:HlyD family secretion protein|nr:efflux RND transporter periplasmic adaptor subunit [Thermoanaerobaculales bacterium]
MLKKKVLIPLIVVLVVVAVAVFSLRGRGGDEGVGVTVEPVGRHTVIQTVTATGKIQPMTQVNISADVSAKITRLDVAEGDWVEKGALLLQLDRERYVAAMASAEANLAAAEANANLVRENMNKARKDHERSKQLFESALESEASLDSTYAAAEVEAARYQAALEQVEQARAALRQARDDLDKTTILAPMSGTVSKLNKELGEMALGSQFQEDVILEISNLQGMEALVDVDENDIVSVALGDTAEIEVDALPDTRYPGEVTEIASSAKTSGQGTTDQKTEFEVKVAVTEPGSELRPGMTASAEIVTEVREDCLSVPIQCVAVRTLDQLGAKAAEPVEGDAEPRFTADRDGFVEVVWVIEDGKAVARQVKTGIQSETHIEILGGLAEGDQVVVGSYRAISRDLTDGAAVKLAEPGSPAEG